jgi:signal transduction histidine kinase/HD-like signal output (HDOD) protein
VKKTPKIFQKINLRIPLPSLPQTLFQVIRICGDPHCPAEKMVRVVITDPALTLKLFQVARQFQSQHLSHASIPAAVEALGAHQLKNLALSRLMGRRTNPFLQESHFQFSSFWARSFCCGLLAENLMKETRPQLSQDAYLAGLLQGCGVLLLWANFGKKYESIWIRSGSDPKALRQSEIEAFGTDHPTVARYLLGSLNVHPFIAEALLHQQRTSRQIAYALPLTQAVYSALRICNRMEIGNLTGGSIEAGHPFDPWLLHQVAAKTDLQMERRLQEMQTSLAAVLQTGKTQPADFLPADIAENFHSAFSVQLALQAADAASEKEIQERLQQALLLFFGLEPVRFFDYDPATETLVVRGRSESLDIDGISLELATEAGILAQCLTQQRIIDSFGYLGGENKSVFDREIIALLGTEGMICIPIADRSRKIGVICAGVIESQIPLLLTELERLERFGRQATRILGPSRTEETERKTAATASVDFTGAARRVVHEVNTPLSIIKNYLALLRSKSADNAEAQEDIRLIREEIDRIPAIIGQLDRATQEQRKPEEVFDVNETIEDLIRLLEKSVFKDTKIRLQFRPDTELPKFCGKKNHLLQVLTNLLKNSAEAMKDGGTVVIETRYRMGETEADQIRITVRDDGPGIPAKVMATLFEPGSSTKGPDHFGLGLSICKDIVELYGGSISGTSREGQGATFRIRLPVFTQK